MKYALIYRKDSKVVFVRLEFNDDIDTDLVEKVEFNSLRAMRKYIKNNDLIDIDEREADK
jgi:hypothetical protein